MFDPFTVLANSVAGVNYFVLRISSRFDCVFLFILGLRTVFSAMCYLVTSIHSVCVNTIITFDTPNGRFSVLLTPPLKYFFFAFQFVSSRCR